MAKKEFLVDITVDGSVGIGKDPSFTLDVEGSANIEGNFFTRGQLAYFNMDQLEDGLLKVNGKTSGVLDIGVTTDTASLEYGDSSIALHDGNVGIGTDDPSRKLEVRASDEGSSGGIVLTDFTNGTSMVARLQDSSTGGRLYLKTNTDSDGVVLNAGGDSYFNNGNVGIGTSDPKTKLHVASANGSDTPTAGTATGGLLVSNVNKSYGINMGVAGAGWSFIQSQRADGNTTLYNLNLQPLGGNVGIGTTTPDVKFEVESTVSASGIRIKNTNNGFASIDIESNRGTGANLGGLRYRQTGQSNSQAEINYVAGTRFDFLLGAGTGGPTQKMSILKGGNVGIGTISPSAKLDVASGDIRLATNATYFRVRDTAGAQPRVLGMNASNNCYVGPIDSYAGGSMIYGVSTGVDKHSFNIGGSEKVTIDGSGNVGIGDNTPSYKLDVNGAIRATGSITENSDESLKENIQTIENACDKVSKLRGVSYNKIGEEDKKIGVIAQEIETVVPEVVTEDIDGIKSVSYTNLVGLLIQSNKELIERVSELENIINNKD